MCCSIGNASSSEQIYNSIKKLERQSKIKDPLLIRLTFFATLLSKADNSNHCGIGIASLYDKWTTRVPLITKNVRIA
jgi:hypothetical protein